MDKVAYPCTVSCKHFKMKGDCCFCTYYEDPFEIDREIINGASDILCSVREAEDNSIKSSLKKGFN